MGTSFRLLVGESAERRERGAGLDVLEDGRSACDDCAVTDRHARRGAAVRAHENVRADLGVAGERHARRDVGFENGGKSILLPNNYKKVGWYLLIVSMVMIAAIVILNAVFGHSDELYEKHSTLLRMMILIPYIALIFICLSKEKQEDEFIRLIRVRILIHFAIFYLSVGMVGGLSENLFQIYQFRTMNQDTNAAMIFLLIMRLLSWFPLLAVVYALVLRKVLYKNLKESSNEE